jgi:aspartate aminotransferase
VAVNLTDSASLEPGCRLGDHAPVSTVLRRFARRLQSVVPSPTLAVSNAAAALRKQGADLVDFGLGEPDFDTPGFVKRAGIAAIEANKTKYTDVGGTSALREAVAKKFRLRGAEVTAANVVVGAGGKQGLFDACQALFDEGDDVAVFSPFWVSFPEMVRLAGARPIFAKTDRAKGFRPTLEGLADSITEKTRGLILNSPVNPTGAVVEERELLAILRFCRDREIFVLFDECYEHFVYEDRPHVSPVPFWKEHGDHVLVSGGASKTFSMTGWRLGWAVGPTDLIAAMTMYQSHATANASSISQEAALVALTNETEARLAISGMLAEYAKRRERMVSALNAIEGIDCVTPDGAFYAFADVSALYPKSGAKGSAEFARLLLERARVVAVPGCAFGDDRFIRFSFATNLDAIDEGMRRLAGFVRTLA